MAENGVRKKILVIDVENIVRALINKTLSTEFTIYEAENGVEAVRILEESTPDLMVLDIKMPDRDGYSFLSHLKEEYKKKLIDKPAPDFSLFDLDGNKVTLSKLKGKIVIIDLWATWCHWCIKAFPLMKEAQEKYKNDKNVVFLFMDTFEQGNKQKENARKFMTENNYPFHVILDTDSKAAKSYGVRGIPTKLFSLLA